MKDIFEKLKNMDKAQLKNALKQAKAFAATPEGKDFVEKVKSSGSAGGLQKENVMEEIGKNPDLAKMISEIFNAKE